MPGVRDVPHALTLSDRVWRGACGAVHDRDRNAAWNIRAEGIHRHGAHKDAKRLGSLLVGKRRRTKNPACFSRGSVSALATARAPPIVGRDLQDKPSDDSPD